MALQLPALATGQGQRSIGSALRTIAQMRQSDERNALLQAQGQRSERLLGLQERKFEAGEKREQAVTGLREDISAAGPGEMPALLQKLVTQYPEEGKKYIDGMDALDDRGRAQAKDRSDKLGAFLTQVQSLPPEQRAMAYSQGRAQLGELGAGLAEQYDPKQADLEHALALGSSDYLALKPKVPTALEAARTAKVKLETKEIKSKAESREDFIKSLTGEDDLGGGAGADVLADDLVGGAGEETLVGGAGDAMPTNRQIFQSLSPQVQAGILASSDPQKAFSSALLKSKGLDIRFDANGQISSITQGGAGMTKPTKTKLETKRLAAVEGYTRIRDMKKSFKPEYQETAYRAGQAWASLKDRFGGLDNAEKTELKAFTKDRRRAHENLNLYIKEITGAQMSEAEAERLTKAMPTPGEGVFDGDSPIQYESKMDDVLSTMRKAQVRHKFMLDGGLDLSGDDLEAYMALDNIMSMQERGDALFEELGDKMAVKRQLREEGYIQ